MCKVDWEAFAKVVSAFAPYAWPVVVLILCLVFRAQLKGLPARVTEAFGVKFAPAVSELAALKLPPPSAPAPAPGPTPSPTAGSGVASTGPFGVTGAGAIEPPIIESSAKVHAPTFPQAPSVVAEQVSEEADASAPEVAVVALAIQFEQELRRFALVSGRVPPDEVDRVGAARLLDMVRPLIPDSIAAAAAELIKARNQLVHGLRVDGKVFADARVVAKQLIDYFRQRNGVLLDQKSSA